MIHGLFSTLSSCFCLPECKNAFFSHFFFLFFCLSGCFSRMRQHILSPRFWQSWAFYLPFWPKVWHSDCIVVTEMPSFRGLVFFLPCFHQKPKQDKVQGSNVYSTKKISFMPKVNLFPTFNKKISKCKVAVILLCSAHESNWFISPFFCAVFGLCKTLNSKETQSGPSASLCNMQPRNGAAFPLDSFQIWSKLSRLVWLQHEQNYENCSITQFKKENIHLSNNVNKNLQKNWNHKNIN